jgi:hypothetical protein
LVATRFILLVTAAPDGAILSLAAGRAMHVQEPYEKLKKMLDI